MAAQKGGIALADAPEINGTHGAVHSQLHTCGSIHGDHHDDLVDGHLQHPCDKHCDDHTVRYVRDISEHPIRLARPMTGEW